MTRSTKRTPAKRATAKAQPKPKAKAAAKATAKPAAKPKAKPRAGRVAAPPAANELQNWYFMAAPTGTTPEALCDLTIAGALDLLVDLGLDDHELLAWNAGDNHTMLEDDERGGFTAHADPATAQIVRFDARAALRAGLGARAIAGTLSSLPSDLVSGWIAARAGKSGDAQPKFYACELLALGDRPELDRAWQTGNVAAWRYALALAQNRPLMAKFWQSKIPKTAGG